MRQRVYQHTHNDSWNQGKDWIIEYFEDASFTRNDAEYYEAHLIHRYETYKYFNMAKEDFGPGTWIPKTDPEWKMYVESDFSCVPLDTYVNKVRDQLSVARKRLLEKRKERMLSKPIHLTMIIL